MRACDYVVCFPSSRSSLCHIFSLVSFDAHERKVSGCVLFSFLLHYNVINITLVISSFPFHFFFRTEAVAAVEKLYERGVSDYLVGFCTISLKLKCKELTYS